MKKIKYYKIHTTCIILLTVFFLTSCATTIKFPVQRPAEVDSKGATTISVLPFSYGNMIPFYYYNFNYDSEFIATYIHGQLQDKLSQSDFFTQVASTTTLNALKSGLKPPCDIYITGSVYNFSNNLYTVIVKNDPEKESEKNKNKKKEEKVFFGRRVTLSVNYQVVYAATGEVLYSTTQHIDEETSKYEHKREVPGFFSLIQYELDSKIRSFAKKLVPYTTTKRISLLKDKSKDPLIEEQMKVASQIAKDGNYTQAHAIFMEIYQRDRIFEAGYNAALLYEVMGQLDEAALLMSQIYFNTNNPKAQKALKDIQQEIRYREQLQRQLNAQKRNESKDEVILQEK